jgi:hypothetical protein
MGLTILKFKIVAKSIELDEAILIIPLNRSKIIYFLKTKPNMINVFS